MLHTSCRPAGIGDNRFVKVSSPGAWRSSPFVGDALGSAVGPPSACPFSGGGRRWSCCHLVDIRCRSDKGDSLIRLCGGYPWFYRPLMFPTQRMRECWHLDWGGCLLCDAKFSRGTGSANRSCSLSHQKLVNLACCFIKSILHNVPYNKSENPMEQKLNYAYFTGKFSTQMCLRWFQRGRLKLDEDLKFSEKVQNKYTHRMAK